jgi:hypothetical protein
VEDPYRQLEASARHPVGGAVLHPDACPKLVIQGVAWSVPPRGLSITPTFKDGAVTVQVCDDPWPEALALAKAMPLTAAEVCGTCGRPLQASLSIDLGDAAFLGMVFSLAARLLRSQYELSDAQLGELLAFRGDGPPLWVKDLLLWCANG